MPAPAVIPAPRAYIYVAAVKKLVVGYKSQGCDWGRRLKARPEVVASRHNTPRLFHLVGVVACRSHLNWCVEALSESLAPQGTPTDVTVSKSECSKQAACRLNVKAWDNKGSTTKASFCWFSSLSVVTSRWTSLGRSLGPTLGALVESCRIRDQ